MSDMTIWKPDNAALDLMRRTVASHLDPDEFDLFVAVCARVGLDPIAKQIYAVKRFDKSSGRQKMTIQTAIDGFRLIAERTGKYTGQLGPHYYHPERGWQDYWVEDEAPPAVRIGVCRTDFPAPIWQPARTKSYNARQNLWNSMPEVMIAKCAEALALRRAFPQELSGLYTSDEMDQADAEMGKAASVQVGPAPKAAIDATAAPIQNRIKELAQRAADARTLEEERELANNLRGSVDPGMYVVPGNTRISGKKLNELKHEQVAFLAEKAAVPAMKQAAQDYLDQLLELEARKLLAEAVPIDAPDLGAEEESTQILKIDPATGEVTS